MDKTQTTKKEPGSAAAATSVAAAATLAPGRSASPSDVVPTTGDNATGTQFTLATHIAFDNYFSTTGVNPPAAATPATALAAATTTAPAAQPAAASAPKAAAATPKSFAELTAEAAERNARRIALRDRKSRDRTPS